MRAVQRFVFRLWLIQRLRIIWPQHASAAYDDRCRLHGAASDLVLHIAGLPAASTAGGTVRSTILRVRFQFCSRVWFARTERRLVGTIRLTSTQR
jgi:hypothetical protein